MATTSTGQDPIAGLLHHPPKNPVKQLLAILGSDRRAMVLAVLCTVAASLLNLAQPKIVEYLIVALQTVDWTQLGWMVGALVAVSLASSLASGCGNLVTGRAANRTVKRFRDEGSAMALKVPADKLVTHPSADLVSRCSIDAEHMGEVFQGGPIQTFGSVVVVVGALAAMISIDPILCASAVVMTIVAFGIIIVCSNKMTGFAFARQEAQGAYVAECNRALESVLTLRAFVADSFAQRRLRASSTDLRKASDKTTTVQAFLEPVVTLAIQVAMVGIILMAFIRVSQGHLAPESLVSFFMYTLMIIQPAASTTGMVMMMADTLGALKRLIELRDLTLPTPPSEEALSVRESILSSMRVIDRGFEVRPKSADPDVIDGEIRFRNVSVTYAGGGAGTREWALQDVSFDVAPGSWVSLSGTSGSGKSTILSLLERFVQPSRGLIMIDGHPIEDRDEDVYRSQVGYIEQACPLFSGTVRDNLLLGRDHISDDECWDILDNVGLGSVIRDRPEGLDAPVGESSYAFSGGERQRLAIARTLLVKPRILLLDEITSGLDVLNREQIMTLIRSSMSGVTTFAAGHGKFGTDWADTVLVLDKGRLVEAGSPAEVSARSALFRSLIAH